MLPYQLHQKLRQRQQVETSSSSLSILKGKVFWYWDKEQHTQEYLRTNGQCCFNHIVGLPTKDGKEYPLFDYEKILSIETKRRIFDKKIIFYYEDEYITLGYITSSNVEAFIDLLQRNSKTSTGL